jgi:hypothetical protein
LQSGETNFSSLTATYSITNGIATNTDLIVVSPAVRMTGSGTASLPARTVDYQLRSSLAASPTGAPGLEIPVRIQGPWDRPNIALDLAAIAENPQAALAAVQKALSGEQVQRTIDKIAGSNEAKAIGGLISGLLRKGQAPAAHGTSDNVPTSSESSNGAGEPSLIEQLIQQQKQSQAPAPTPQ